MSCCASSVKFDPRKKGAMSAVLDQAVSAGQVYGSITRAVSGDFGAIFTNGFPADGPYTQSTVFEIGSITKTLTGLLICCLIDSQYLCETDAIQRFLPEIEIDPSILVWHLASHTSGLPDFPTPFDANWIVYPTGTYTRRMLLDSVRGFIPPQAPGTVFSYSNVGISLLGIIAEKVTGKPYEQLIDAYVTRPLAMHDTRFDLDLSARRAMPHGTNLLPAPYSQLGALAPSGGLKSTIVDLSKYLRFLSSPRECPNSLLARAALRMRKPLFEIEKGKTFMHFCILSALGGSVFFHNGEVLGMEACVAFDPIQKKSIIVLTSNVNPQLLDTTFQMMEILRKP
jgi:CubicO group peptidase (beta-lactamase class C family)